MKPATLEPTPVTVQTMPRCSHRTSTGRQCRSQANDTHSGLCLLHSARATTRHAHPSVSSELLGPITEFQSASDVTDFLSRLLILQAQDRISPRRAAVMAYTCNLLLRAHRAMDLEAIAAQAAEDAPGQQVVFELTRSNRDTAPQTPAPTTKPS